MKVPQEIYAGTIREGMGISRRWQTDADHLDNPVKYIRADIAELTKEDVYDIWRLYNEVCMEREINGHDETNEEVLRRFKDYKAKER